ncbi:MAG: ABC transporter substrate-binding protein [bacterium]
MSENTNETLESTRVNQSSLLNRIKITIKSFSIVEKTIFYALLVVFIISGLAILDVVNKSFTVSVPTYTGTYTEGIVGYARFINPLISYTDADKDMTSLIYAGLLKPSEGGQLVPELADSYTVSDDGLTYDFKLKSNLTFHDGSPLTTDDVEFTIQKVSDVQINSPKALNWNGVQIQKVSPTEIKFILKKPYAPFIENMAMGILPKHIWSVVSPEAFDISAFNREPVGAGAYKIKSSSRDSSGIYQSYTLESFSNYEGGKPLIKDFVVKFYKNEDDAVNAYNKGEIDGLGGITPAAAVKANIKSISSSNEHVVKSTLPRLFAVFFNQSQAPVLLNKEVRQALNTAINRDTLIKNVFNGFATPATGPIPYDQQTDLDKAKDVTETDDINGNTTDADNPKPIEIDNIEVAKKILTDAGWKMNDQGIMTKVTKTGKTSSTQTLTFSFSTSNIPELKKTAEELRDIWAKIGAKVDLEIFDPADLNSKVIRPRKYSALLFGNIINRDLDLYPFWHSSQRNDPGLNIALYANLKVDKLLDTARSSTDDGNRLEAYKSIEKEINNDVPAIFLYSPDYIYLTSGRAKGITIENLNHSSERFANVNKWYTDTENIWKFLIKTNTEK